MLDFSCLLKYFLEGLAVAVAAYVLPGRGLKFQEILLLALSAAATFALLDQFSPEVARGSRFGSGFSIGTGLVA